MVTVTSSMSKAVLLAKRIKTAADFAAIPASGYSNALWVSKDGRVNYGELGRCDNCHSLYSINTVTITQGISPIGWKRFDIEECTIDPETEKCMNCPAEPTKKPTAVKKAVKLTPVAAPAVKAQPVVAPVNLSPATPEKVLKSGDNVIIRAMPENGVGIITRVYHINNKTGQTALCAGKDTTAMCDVYFTKLGEQMQFPMRMVEYRSESSAASRIIQNGREVLSLLPTTSMAATLFDSAIEKLIQECRNSDSTGYPYAVGVLKEMLRKINNECLDTTEQRNLLKAIVHMETIAKLENKTTHMVAGKKTKLLGIGQYSAAEVAAGL
jgi:hypothetical protein